MIQLPETHPEAQMMLENGEFGVQRTTEHGFAQLPIDHRTDIKQKYENKMWHRWL